MTSLVVTLIGPDRPGMVKAVSDKATDHGANWADSLMANFAGQFAGIVHLDVPPARCEALLTALRALAAPDLQITVTRADARPSAGATRRLTLELLGHDHPGIIQSISSQLAQHGVSIDKLSTRILSGAMSGEQMFQMHAGLTVPATLDTHTLQSALESLANELMVDISFDAASHSGA
jgi:glycine cleavage system regulatory protein